MRDKLFKLVQSSKEPCDNGFCPYESDDVSPCCICEAESLVDHLIAHGVTLATDTNVGGKKPLTNGDRIRAMTDEELAWELMTWRIETAFRLQGVESDYPYTKKSILNWLKQPAKEET